MRHLPPTLKKELTGKDHVFSILDETNPMSLINMVPQYLKAPIAEVYGKGSYLINLPEKNLKKEVRPDDVDDRTRLAFWDEYHRATECGDKQMYNQHFINSHSLPIEEFMKRYVYKPGAKLIYLTRPPLRYGVMMRVLLQRGVERLQEIMEMPIENPKTGQVNTALIAQILKAYQMIDLRVKGAIVQKMQIDQRSLNLNQELPATDSNIQLRDTQILRELSSMSMEELEKLDKKLNRLERLKPNPDEDIEVLPVGQSSVEVD